MAELAGPGALLQFEPELPMVQIQERPECLGTAGNVGNGVLTDTLVLTELAYRLLF